MQAQWAKGLLHRDTVFALCIAAVISALVLMPPLYQSPYVQNVNRARATVVDVDDSHIQQYGIVKAGSQLLRVRILDGEFAGHEVEAINDLIGKMETDKMFAEGDTAFVVLTLDGERLISARAFDHYRLNTELLLLGLFAALLVGFAGWSGLRALLSFAFAVLMLWKVLLPSILVGLPPMLVAVGTVALMAAVTLFLVAGVSRTALVALGGALLGVLLTVALASLLLPSFKLHGAILPYSETLLYSGFADLNLTQLFLAAVFIGASGAVIDVSIDVAASMNEVALRRPDLPFGDLWASGVAVGRAMVSTMVTTLLTAYAAGYMALLMIFIAQGVPPVNILNTNYIAAEILKTLVGSFGLVTVAPFTALVGAVVFSRWRLLPVPVPSGVQPTQVPTPQPNAPGPDLAS